MRNLKFRSFENGKFYYSDDQDDAKLLGAKLGGSCIATFFNRFYLHPTLGQFTGLTDKNGKEIYEGDVINYLGANGIVSYKEDWAMFVAEFKKNRSVWSFDSLNEEIEIIGNIHENSDLI